MEDQCDVFNYVQAILPGFDRMAFMLSEPKDHEKMSGMPAGDDDAAVPLYECCVLFL